MVVRFRRREETCHVRLGPRLKEGPEPVIQGGVRYSASALLAQVLIPAWDDEHLDELSAALGVLKDGPADRAGPAAAPADGLRRLLEVVLGPGPDLVGDGYEDRAAVGGNRQGHIRRGEGGRGEVEGSDGGESPAHPGQQREGYRQA